MLKLHENPALIDVLTELGTAQFVKTNVAEIAGNERMLRRVFGYPKQAPEPAASQTGGSDHGYTGQEITQTKSMAALTMSASAGITANAAPASGV